MGPLISYTLPAIQLVWILVVPGALAANIANLDSSLAVQSENPNLSNAENLAVSGLKVTPTSNPAVTESSPKVGTKTLPDGYTSFPELGVAFKYHRDEKVTWRNAAQKCVDEGGNLVVTDSWRKYDVIRTLLTPGDFTYVGIRRTDEFGDWVNIRTGSPLSTIPWKSGEPIGAYFHCVATGTNARGLWSTACFAENYFVCEIDIPKRH